MEIEIEERNKYSPVDQFKLEWMISKRESVGQVNFNVNESIESNIQIGKRQKMKQISSPFFGDLVFESINWKDKCTEFPDFTNQNLSLVDLIIPYAEDKSAFINERSRLLINIKNESDQNIRNIRTFSNKKVNELLSLTSMSSSLQITDNTKEMLKDQINRIADPTQQEKAISDQVQISQNSLKQIENSWPSKLNKIIHKQKQSSQNHLSKKQPNDQNNIDRITEANRIFEEISFIDIEIPIKNERKINEIIDTLENCVQVSADQQISQKEKVNSMIGNVKKKIYDSLQKLPDFFENKRKEVIELYKLPAFDSEQTQTINLSTMKLTLTFDDLKRLRPGSLINDQILTVYSEYLKMSFLQMRNETNSDEQIVLIPPYFFCENYNGYYIDQAQGLSLLEEFCQIDRLFDQSKVNRFGFMVNVTWSSCQHWIFLGVDNSTMMITCYDSVNAKETYQKYAPPLAKFLKFICGKDYSIRQCPNIPKQQNGYDCGMYVLKYMQNFTYGKPQEFTQAEIDQFRRNLYIFFPLLARMQAQNKLQFDLLDYFSTKDDSNYQKELNRIKTSIS